jgi:hypothetical protein
MNTKRVTQVAAAVLFASWVGGCNPENASGASFTPQAEEKERITIEQERMSHPGMHMGMGANSEETGLPGRGMMGGGMMHHMPFGLDPGNVMSPGLFGGWLGGPSITALGNCPLCGSDMMGNDFLQKEDVKGFLDATVDLRRAMLLKKFDLMEALRAPEASKDTINQLHRELKDLVRQYVQKAPAEQMDSFMGSDMMGIMHGMGWMTAHIMMEMSPAVSNFLDETRELRRDIMLKRFEIFEALRNSDTPREIKQGLNAEYKAMVLQLFDKMYELDV